MQEPLLQIFGLIKHSLTSVEHVVPLKPVLVQLQKYPGKPLGKFLHTPPFEHGELAQ